MRLGEGLTEAGEQDRSTWGVRGYLRGLGHAWLACGWLTCVALLDLRRLLMAREPPGPGFSCKKEGKQLTVWLRFQTLASPLRARPGLDPD